MTSRTCVPRFLALAVAFLGACTPEHPQEPLRVLTYNIAAGHGDLAGIADVIREAGADIIALQEVDVHWHERSRFEDQAAVLAESLGFDVGFGPIYTLPGNDSVAARQFGLAILSRYPIAAFHNHEITRLSTQTDDAAPQLMPGFIEAVIQVGESQVRVFDTHLDYRPDPHVRERQVADMLERIGDAAGPVILMGDLNASPGAPELAPLLDRFSDSWTAAAPGHTYPADAPVRRIDYVLVSDDFIVSDVRVIDTAVSDHRPVVADLLLRSR